MSELSLSSELVACLWRRRELAAAFFDLAAAGLIAAAGLFAAALFAATVDTRDCCGEIPSASTTTTSSSSLEDEDDEARAMRRRWAHLFLRADEDAPGKLPSLSSWVGTLWCRAGNDNDDDDDVEEEGGIEPPPWKELSAA